MTFALFSLAGCSDFLDRPSKTEMNDENYWTSEGNIRLFVNNAYPTYFNGYSSGWGQEYAPGVYSSGEFSDDGSNANKQTNPVLSIPTDNWYRRELSSNRPAWLFRYNASPWNFGFVRKWNLLIERLDMMQSGSNPILTEEQYKHWMGAARFFRGVEYSRLVESFGDVPYYDKVIGSADTVAQYKDRDPRTTVMTKCMEDFDYAIENLRASDGTNYLNKYVAAAYASRYMLFEGTWYKYHPNSGTNDLAKQFLQKAVSYAEVVMNSGKYKFDVDFRSLFGGETQVGNETLIYRSYSADLSITHCIASYSNLDENQTRSANLWFLKSVLCTDGKPYTSSSVADAASFDLADMVKTRDSRFEATFWDEPHSGGTSVYCVKFIDRVGPTYAYNGQARPPKYGSSTNTNGYPCIRLAEVVLNWIEAKQELALSYGGAAVTQADIDKSINAIRDRPLAAEAIAKGVTKTAHLLLSDIPSDPIMTCAAEQAKLGAVGGAISDPLLWEIRRERRLEFFMEQHRTSDIRRWGKLALMQGSTNPDVLVGGWIDMNATEGLKVGFNLLTAGTKGSSRVMKADGTVVTWDGTNAADMVGFRIPTAITDRDQIQERNYLEPICQNVVDQYKAHSATITQNPGW